MVLGGQFGGSELRLNANYYITKQIIPALSRVFQLVGADVSSWWADMPRQYRHPTMSFPVMDRTGARGVGRTVDHYFRTRTCMLCFELHRSVVTALAIINASLCLTVIYAATCSYVCDRCGLITLSSRRRGGIALIAQLAPHGCSTSRRTAGVRQRRKGLRCWGFARHAARIWSVLAPHPVQARSVALHVYAKPAVQATQPESLDKTAGRCDSLDCPVFFSREKANHVCDAQNAIARDTAW